MPLENYKIVTGLQQALCKALACSSCLIRSQPLEKWKTVDGSHKGDEARGEHSPRDCGGEENVRTAALDRSPVSLKYLILQ